MRLENVARDRICKYLRVTEGNCGFRLTFPSFPLYPGGGICRIVGTFERCSGDFANCVEAGISAGLPQQNAIAVLHLVAISELRSSRLRHRGSPYLMRL